jgi:hypothetical protein
MVNLFPEQRIAVNIRKLVASGFASADDTLESILLKEISSNERSGRWAAELRTLSTRAAQARVSGEALGHGGLELTESGEIVYFSDRESALMDTFVNRSPEFVRAVLETDLTEMRGMPRDALERRWKLRP